jgi:hypothetical protein
MEFKVHVAENRRELVGLAKLIRKFIEEAKPNYTEDETWNLLSKNFGDPNIFVVYVTEDEKPIAYSISTIVNTILGPVVMIFQAYSQRPLIAKRMLEKIDQWARVNELDEEVILAKQENEKHFQLHYGFKTICIYMSRKVPELKVEENGTGESTDELVEAS